MSLPGTTEVPFILRLFGSFDVQINGHPLPRLRTQKGRWLLALLVLRQGRQAERSWLAGVLWPESSESQALANLRLSLTDLRRALGAEATRLHAPTPRALRFDLAGAWVDVAAFDAAILRHDTSAQETAIAVYRGDLLEGCEEDWLLPERQRRKEAYLSTLETLAAHASSPADTMNLLRRVISIEPTRETSQRALLEALAAEGDHAGMTQAYRDFRLCLSNTLHTTPDAETVALYRRLRTDARAKAQNWPPVPASAGPTPRRLPSPMTTLVGREAEIGEIAALLDTTRLLTLTGTGGVGKTRLAIAAADEVADDYADGVWFVDLAPLEDPTRVVQAVTLALEVREGRNRPLLETLQEYLQDKSLLLILDNCEHLIGACASLAEALLSRCAFLRLLATSRQSLGVDGEQIWRTPPLSLPNLPTTPDVEAGEPLPVSAAEQLFLERAAAVSPGLSLTAEHRRSVAESCCLLDGLPFAIELAAAWVRVLSVAQIAARLRGVSDLLKNERHAALPRRQTLRATLDWSYRLLCPQEQTLLLRLSVFVGDWTLEAAEAVCAVEGGTPDTLLMLLVGLADKSLVVCSEYKGELRYRLLETTRAYAQEKLSAQARGDVSYRHADYFLRLAEAMEAESQRSERTLWFERIEREYANLCAALDWSLSEGRDPTPPSPSRVELGLRLAAALCPFWEFTRYLSEGRALLQRLLDKGRQVAPAVQARALHKAGRLAGCQRDHSAAQPWFERSLVMAKTSGDRVLEADNLCQLGMLAWDAGDYARARALLEDSLAIYEPLDNKAGMSVALGNLGTVARRQGEFAEAQARYEACLILCQQQGDRQGMSYILKSLGMLAHRKGEWDEAQKWHEQSLVLSQQTGSNWGVATALTNLGAIACARGDYARARPLFAESIRIRQQQKDQCGLIETLEMLARLRGAEGHPQQAATLLGAAETLAAAIQTSLPTVFTDYEQSVAAAQADLGAEEFAAAWVEGRALTLAQFETLLLLSIGG
jgi:non-specific serine/threonine protein kinase